MKTSEIEFYFTWINYLIIVLIVAIVGSFLLSNNLCDFVITFFVPPFFWGGVCLVNLKWNKYQGKKFIFRLFLWAFMIRFIGVYVMEFVLVHYNGIPFVSFKDDYIYNQVAIEIVDRWKAVGFGFYDDIHFSTGTYSGFPNFSAALMYVFGKSHLVPRLGNVVLSSITCIIAYRICQNYASETKSKLVAYMFLFSPLLIVFSALQIKDTLLLFFSMWGVLSVCRLLQGYRNIANAFVLIISCLGISFGRPAAIIPILGAYVCVLLCNIVIGKKNIFKIIWFGCIIYGLIYGWNSISDNEVADLDNYFETRYTSMTDRTILDTDAALSKTSLAKYAGAPLYVLSGLFLPVPLLVELENARINYDSFGLLFHISLLPFLIVALMKVFQDYKSNPIPFYLALVFIFYKLGQANSVMSIFSARQSLSTIFMMYLILPMYDGGNKRICQISLCISIIVMLGYTGVRLYSHGLI